MTAHKQRRSLNCGEPKGDYPPKVLRFASPKRPRPIFSGQTASPTGVPGGQLGHCLVSLHRLQSHPGLDGRVVPPPSFLHLPLLAHSYCCLQSRSGTLTYPPAQFSGSTSTRRSNTLLFTLPVSLKSSSLASLSIPLLLSSACGELPALALTFLIVFDHQAKSLIFLQQTLLVPA